MGDFVWKPESHDSCGEPWLHRWESTVTGYLPNPSKKMTALELQRNFQKDQSLLKLTEDLQNRRDQLAINLTEEVNDEIYKLNKSSLDEIKLLTSRLLEFLRDIKINVEKCTSYDEITPHWKNEWDTNIDEWSCDVHASLRKLRDHIKTALLKGETTFVESKKFTPDRVKSFLNDQVTKLNQLMIVNEKMYTDTERHLKLMFDSLLQSWLISYSYQEIITEERLTCPAVEYQQITKDETESLKDTFTVVDQIVTGLEEDEPEFSQIVTLETYLNHLRTCQQHVKLHLNEALKYLKSHLSKRKDQFLENESKIKLEELWMDIVSILKEQNDEFKNYSKQSACAWNQFVKRLHCCETSTANAINKFRAVKLKQTLVSEQQINTLLDQLRESGSLISMEHIYDKIVIELQNAELICVSCRNEEDEIVKQLVIASFAANDIYSIKMKLLDESQPSTETDVFCVEEDLDETKEITDSEFISMKFCVLSAQTWLQGMRETLSLLEAELPQFLKTFLANLINAHKGESEYWLMLQLEKISKRKQRIRKNVLEVRAFELNVHDIAQKTLFRVIEQHQKKTKVIIKNVKDVLNNSDGALIVHLNETKTNRLEDTAEKKIMNLKNEALIEKQESIRKQTIRKTKYDLERTFKWMSNSCSIYLHSLRLFHEGGNYSSDECDAALKKISKTVKGLTTDCGKTLKKLDSVFSTTREAFKKKLAKIVYPDPTEEELLQAAEREARDRLEICFNRLKEMIKIETYKALRHLNGLNETVNKATKVNDLKSWHESIFNVENFCSYFGLSSALTTLELSNVLGVAKGLAFPSYALQRTSNESTDVVLRADSRKLRKSTATNKHFRKKRGRTVSRNTVHSDISESLFHYSENFTEEDNYLSNVKTLIKDTFASIKPILDDAYAKYEVSRELSAHQKLSAISTLRYYNLQCESVWTFLFLEFLNAFYSICINVLSYVELVKTRFISESINESFKLKINHKTQLSQLNVEGVKESIDNKLKPWHGYPLNKPLLQELLKDVVDHCKGQLFTRKQVNETYRDELKALISATKIKATNISEEAKPLFIAIFANPAINALLESIMHYIVNQNFGGSNLELRWIKEGTTDYCSKTTKGSLKATIPEKYDDDIGFKFLTGHQFWDFTPNMRTISDMMTTFREKLGLPTSSRELERKASFFEMRPLQLETDGEMFEEEPDISLFWTKLKEEIHTHLQGFENTAVKNLVEAKKDFDGVSWDLTRWKNEWISNIKEVNRLYLINPILDPPPKKISSDPGAALRQTKTDEALTE